MCTGNLGRRTQAHLFSFLNGRKALSRKEYFYISLLFFNPPFFAHVPPEFTLLGHVSFLPQSHSTARDQDATTRVSHSQAWAPEFAIALKKLQPPCSATTSSFLRHILVK